MTYTRYEWCDDLAHALNANSLPEVIEFLLGWTYIETSAGKGASYNLLNTTERATGSTNFNDVGVQNFASYSQGVDVNASLIRNSIFYSSIYTAIKNNDIKALGYGASMSIEVNADLQVWVSGKPDGDSQYPTEVHAASNKGANDTFPGNKYSHEQLLAMAISEVQDITDSVNHLNSVIVQL